MQPRALRPGVDPPEVGRMRTQLDRATPQEREVLDKALGLRCPGCGAQPGVWCFKAVGVWSVHAARVLATHPSAPG